MENPLHLAGLPESERSSAAAAAEERGHKGQWSILNTRSSMEPFLTLSERAKLLGYKTHAHWRIEKSMARMERDAGVAALMRKRGFSSPGEGKASR